MPTGLLVRSQYTTNPPVQVSVDSLLQVRGWYNRSFIAGDGVTPVTGNSSNGQQGPYYDIGATLNGDGDLVVAAQQIQATTLSNPTGSYFEGLWVNGAFVGLLMPNTQGAAGWQIPTVYGDPIAFDEIATYNRAKRLLYPPNTYFTADQVIQEIERLAGNFDYMAVGVNGIGQASFPPVVASAPQVLMANDPRVGSWFNITSYFASTTATAAQNAVFIAAAVAAATSAGGGIYVPVGTFSTNSVTISVPIMFAPGASILSPATGQTITITKSVEANPQKHFGNATSGLGTIVFTGNTQLEYLCPLWWGGAGDDSTDCTAAFQAALHVSEYNGSLKSVRYWLPLGTYRVTGLTYKGDFSTTFIWDAPPAGQSLSDDGAILKYTGTSGGTIFSLLGANNCILYNPALNGNSGLAAVGLLIDYDSGRSQSSFNCSVYNPEIGGLAGVDSTCIKLGSSNFASAEHRIYNPSLVGHSTPGTTYFGITASGSNAKNFDLFGGLIQGFKWGIQPGNSGYHNIYGPSFAGNTEGDFSVLTGNQVMAVFGGGSEGSTKLLDGEGIATSSAGSVDFNGFYWTGASVGDDYIVIFTGALAARNCSFANTRTATSVPAFKVIQSGTAGSSFTSSNNDYQGCFRTVTDVVTNSTTTITSATAVFTDADIGKTIVLSGGGSLTTIIATRVNSTTVTLATAPGWSTAGNTAQIQGFLPVYDTSDHIVTSATPGDFYNTASNPALVAGVSLSSYGDCSRPTGGGNPAFKFPVRYQGQQVYTLGISSTAIASHNLRGTVTFSTAGSATVTFGIDEYDTNYYIVLSGNTNAERFTWASKLKTGFTINSSNASSIAIVDWAIFR